MLRYVGHDHKKDILCGSNYIIVSLNRACENQKIPLSYFKTEGGGVIDGVNDHFNANTQNKPPL